MGTRQTGLFIFGSHMQNVSEYPMRQTSPLASAAATAFIHNVCLSEVDSIEKDGLIM